jgi:hypothetical protein
MKDAPRLITRTQADSERTKVHPQDEELCYLCQFLINETKNSIMK